MTTPTLTHDAISLLHAIRLQPGEDTPRLALADLFDEHADSDHAELIRVQMELVREYPTLPWPCKSSVCIHPGCALHKRVAELVAAMECRRPPCPVCGPHSNGLHRDGLLPTCQRCSGAGRVGTFHRGLLTLEVPTLDAVWERKRMECPGCKGREVLPQPNTVGGTYTCTRCEGDGFVLSASEWQPTPWAETLRDEYPWIVGVLPLDKRPFSYRDAPGYGWSRNRPTYRDHPDEVLPPHIWDLLPPGNVYDSVATAKDALAMAVALSVFQ